MLRQIKTLPVLMLLLASIVSAQSVGDSINNGSSGGGLPSGGSVGQSVVNTGSGTGTWQGGLTVYVPAGTSGIAATPVAGTTYLITGNDSEPAAITVSANNVTVQCYPGVKITRSGTTDLFDVSGNNFTLKGCILDGASQSASGTGPIVNVTGNDAHIYNNVFQNTGVTNPSTAFIYQTAGARMKVDYNTGTCVDNCIMVVPAASTIVSDWEAVNNDLTAIAAATIRGIGENDQATGAGVAGGLIQGNTIRFQDGGNQGYGIGCNNRINAALGTSNSYGLRVANNHLFATGTSNALVHCFGIIKSTWTGNVANDNGQAFGNYLFDFGDAYDSTFTGNQAFGNGSGNGDFHFIDFSRIAVTGNVANGISVAGTAAGFEFDTTAGLGSDSQITGNNVILNASAGFCYQLNSATASFSFTDDAFEGNSCTGTSTAGQIAWKLIVTAGTFANIHIQDSKAIKVPTGFSVGNSVTGVVIDNPFFDTVTTHYSLGTGLVQVHDFTGLTFANIPANLANGSMLYVSDSTIANPCAGSGTGAMLKRLNGVNVCN